MTNPTTHFRNITNMSLQDAGVFQVYRRGFVGRPVKEVDKKSINSSIMKQLKNLQFNQTASLYDEKNHVSNEDIEVLYAQYTKKTAKTGTFDFHELIIQAALEAFGTKQFIEWIDLQNKSPEVNYLNSRFLRDTLKFIETGKREMVLENWEPLLNSDGVVTGEWENVTQDAIELNKRIRIIDLKDVIRIWCSQPNGLSDMLITLHILFGK